MRKRWCVPGGDWRVLAMASVAWLSFPAFSAVPTPTDTRALRAGVLATATTAAAAYWGVAPQRVLLREPDARLQPPDCPGGFVGKPAPGTAAQSRVTLEVACRGTPWRTFVSARLAENVADNGADNGADDGVDGGVDGGADNVTDNRAASKAPRPPARAAAAVRRGAPVTLYAGTTAFRVTTAGVALADAPLGAWVRVRNAATGRELEGKVVGEAQVMLAPLSPALQGIPQVAAEAVDNTSVGHVARRGDDT